MHFCINFINELCISIECKCAYVYRWNRTAWGSDLWGISVEKKEYIDRITFKRNLFQFIIPKKTIGNLDESDHCAMN